MRASRRGLAAVAALALAPGLSAAQSPGGDIDLQAFRPAMDSRGFITLNASQVLGPRELSFGLVTNWGRSVLKLEQDGATYEVENLITPALIAALGLRLGRLELELGASVPFTIMSGDRGPDDDGGTPDDPNDDQAFRFDGQGLGDVGLHVKVRLLATTRGPRLGLAVIGSVYLPTASEGGKWLGDGAVSPQAMLVLDKELGPIKLAFNGGVRLRTGGSERFADDTSLMGAPVTGQLVESGASAVPFGAGIAYALAPQRFELVGEVFGALPLGGENYFPLEAIGGIKVYLARNSFLSLGGGAGFRGAAAGSPDLRAFLGIVFEPNIGDRDGDGIKDDIDQCPDDPEDFDDFEDQDGCPEPDNDRDQILDVDDKCPNVPEDRDGFEDEDGCPDVDRTDRDGDRILDDVDQCPDDPEDYDGWQDEDGCPDPDNDEDLILDVDDLCPNEPEDKDGWEDEDGCPDPDNDRDRILDHDDACPNEPENYNGNRDEDGCPDPDTVIDAGGELVVLESVYFEFNRAVIKPESFPVLDAVAYTLELNPDIKRIEIEGHTDARGSDAYNLKLSADRAHAVRTYFIEHGVAADRMTARGYGERVPLEDRQDEEAYAKNRRVEFIILKRDTD